MTTDLRAALRDRLAAAFDAAWEATGEGFNGEYTRRSFTSEMYERMRAEHIDKILADAPPTVAEMLPLVDETREARWTAIGGEAMRCIGVPTREGVERRVEFQRAATGRWQGCSLGVTDVDRPATLVEVTP